MRIGFFTDDYHPRKDGAVYTIDAWRQKLEKRGHEVYTIYPDSADYDPGERDLPVRSLNNPFYNGHRIPVPGKPDLPELDIYHCHSPFPLGTLARFRAWRSGKPSVYTFHTPLEHYIPHFLPSRKLSGIISRMYVWLETLLIQSFDLVTYNTGEFERDIEAVELPVGIDMEFFSPTEESFVDQMNLEKPVLGYNKRMSEEKDIEELLTMAGRFDGSLILMGEGRHREELERKAPGNVRFIDFVDREKLPEFYSGIDLFVTASPSETLSLTSLEANSCNTPVIAPDLPPFSDTITDENGLRYQKGNIDEMLERIEEALRREFEPRKGVERFSMEKTIDRLEELYRGLKNGD